MSVLSLAFGSSKNPAHRGGNEAANAAIPHATDAPTSVEDEQYRAAERERTRTFLLAEQKRELDFLDAEATRRKPEETRNEDFKRFLADDTKLFGEGQKAREVAFVEQETKQEEFFKEKEEARNGAFEAAQKKRGEVFQSSQERRLRRAKWYATQREEVSKKGRAKRDKQFEAFVGDLQRQFDQFLKTETESLIELQNQRKANADNKAASAGDPNLSSPPIANDIGDDSHTDDGIASDGEEGLPIGDRIVTLPTVVLEVNEPVLPPRSSSRDPTYHPILAPVPPPTCIPVIQDFASQEPPVVIPVISEPTAAAPSQPVPVPRNQPPTYNESDFQMKQEERERVFKEGQQIRGNKFQEGETKRESAHHARQRDFDEHADQQKEFVKRAQAAFLDSFNHRQTGRDQGADVRRGSFNALLIRIQGTFEQDLLWFAEKYRAEKKFLDADGIARDHRVTSVFSSMQQKVHDTLENLMATIIDYNATYSFDTSRPPSIISTVASAESLSSASSIASDISTPGLPPIISIPPVIPFNPQRPVHDLAPELSFVPQTIFQQAMGTMFSIPLPITEESNVNSKNAMSMSSLLKKSQSQSDAAERQRKALYHFEEEQYHYQFTVNEHRRQLQFKNQLQQCRFVVDKQNSEWTREFMISQGSRLQQFYEKEKSRVEREVAAVVEREKKFAEAQERRTKAFHELQEKLQGKCVNAESASQSTFERLLVTRRKQFDKNLVLWKGWFVQVSTPV